MEWQSLAGEWQCSIPGQCGMIRLPGTLDEYGFGGVDRVAAAWHPDLADNHVPLASSGPITTRLTRRHTFTGQARLERRVAVAPGPGRRLFFYAERARALRLFVDGEEVPDAVPPTLSTPRLFELPKLRAGEHLFTLLSDNRYPGWPAQDILYSSAATDETQTNWNGVLGRIGLVEKPSVFLYAVRVYPHGDTVCVRLVLDSDAAWQGRVVIRSPALEESITLAVDALSGRSEITADALRLKRDVARWDEYEGRLHDLTATLECEENGEARVIDKATVRFGVRDFGAKGGRLTLNGRVFFLRGEANCAVFPETGYPPMDAQAWRDVLKTYKSYGVNCVRFHSHCPPEAAFVAADEAGMLLEPELSHWNPRDALVSETAQRYYRRELAQILYTYANHPSFVMLTLGNELATDERGLLCMYAMLGEARAIDDTRLYACASNAFYGARGANGNDDRYADCHNDFYTAMRYYDAPLRATFNAGPNDDGIQGNLNHREPDGKANYNDTLARIRERYAGPVFGFEVGQFEILPDFDQLADFTGITDPANLRLVQQRVQEKGMEGIWRRYVQASGELALLCYREEVEAVLRTPQMSGLSLLGLQDFPGQGTALIGMLDAHLHAKPYAFADPRRFAAFFRPRLPLVELDRYTWTTGEAFVAQVRFANYGRGAVHATPMYCLRGQGVCQTGFLPEQTFAQGTLRNAGFLRLRLPQTPVAARYDLSVTIGEDTNTYPLWVYPEKTPRCPETVYTAHEWNDRARAVLAGGGTVYLTPPSTEEALPHSIRPQFTTDFWCVGSFPCQEGTMGQYIESDHPLFLDFPTETYTNWQWWHMARQRAVLLPVPIKAIVTVMDSCTKLRSLAQLFECRCGGGRLLFSSLGLEDLEAYPEARALQCSIYRYLASEDFDPQQTLPLAVLERLFCKE